jgi:pyrimidine operon attenuation protein / uracil phosphoribosyltransferase
MKIPINNQLQSIETLLNTLVQGLKEHLLQLDDEAVLIGIRTGGVWVAEHLHKALGISSDLGKLDISFYRDDFEAHGLHPEVKPSDLPFDVDNAHIVLIDDVVMTGRTIRAALNEIFDYGRPSSVTLVSLIDLNKRQLPIRPDICGQKLSLLPTQRVELTGPEPLSLKIVDKKINKV